MDFWVYGYALILQKAENLVMDNPLYHPYTSRTISLTLSLIHFTLNTRWIRHTNDVEFESLADFGFSADLALVRPRVSQLRWADLQCPLVCTIGM